MSNLILGSTSVKLESILNGQFVSTFTSKDIIDNVTSSLLERIDVKENWVEFYEIKHRLLGTQYDLTKERVIYMVRSNNPGIATKITVEKMNSIISNLK